MQNVLLYYQDLNHSIQIKASWTVSEYYFCAMCRVSQLNKTAMLLMDNKQKLKSFSDACSQSNFQSYGQALLFLVALTLWLTELIQLLH